MGATVILNAMASLFWFGAPSLVLYLVYCMFMDFSFWGGLVPPLKLAAALVALIVVPLNFATNAFKSTLVFEVVGWKFVTYN